MTALIIIACVVGWMGCGILGWSLGVSRLNWDEDYLPFMLFGPITIVITGVFSLIDGAHVYGARYVRWRRDRRQGR